MILPVEAWMDLRRYQPLRDAGATWREIADEVGLDWRTVKKYLSTDAPAGPPTAPSRTGCVTRKIDAVAPVIDAWLAADPRLKASVIHERLVAEHGFDGHYQRVKLYVAEARQRLAARTATTSRLRGLHRRFEVVAGAQAQVDWGDEGAILLEQGIAKVYSFHMTLSYSRDPFCCFTTSQDLGTFFDCHRRAFAHFGGVPGSDRLRPHQDRRPPPCRPARGGPAAPGGGRVRRSTTGSSSTCWPPTGRPGRVGWSARSRSCATTSWPGARFDSLAELDGAFAQWVPIRRGAASTAPTASSSASAPRLTGPRCGRCPSCPTWSASGICAGSGGTA